MTDDIGRFIAARQYRLPFNVTFHHGMTQNVIVTLVGRFMRAYACAEDGEILDCQPVARYVGSENWTDILTELQEVYNPRTL